MQCHEFIWNHISLMIFCKYDISFDSRYFSDLWNKSNSFYHQTKILLMEIFSSYFADPCQFLWIFIDTINLDTYANPLFLLRYSWESIDCQTEVSRNTLNKEGCKKSRLWLGTFILSQYIISSQISFALSIRGKGQNKHLTFAIFVLVLVHRAFLQCNMNCLMKKIHEAFQEEIIERAIE